MTSPPGNSVHQSPLEPRGLPLRPGRSSLFSQRAVPRDLQPRCQASSQLSTGVSGRCTALTGLCLQRIGAGRSRVVVSSVGWPLSTPSAADQASETENKVPLGWHLSPGCMSLLFLADFEYIQSESTANVIEISIKIILVKSNTKMYSGIKTPNTS